MSVRILFVYGTLKRGGRYAAAAAGYTRLEPARARGRLYALRAGYPALLEVGDGEVRGEALFYDDLEDRLAGLDALEGFDPVRPGGSLFLRVTRPIFLESNPTPREAFIYVMPPEREDELVQRGARLLSDGLWTDPRPSFEEGDADRLNEDVETP